MTLDVNIEASGLVAQLATSMGVAEAALRLVLSILIGFPLAHLHRKTLYGKLPLHQHVFFITSGLILGIWNFGWDMSHSFIALSTTYLILLVFGSSSLAVGVVFIFNMLYLSWGYITTCTQDYDIKWTMPHCVLTLRLIGLAWNYADGSRDEKSLSEYQKKVALKKLPSFIECAAYTYFPASFLIGPQFSITRYLDYVHGRLINKDAKGANELPDCIAAGVRRTLLGFFYLFVHQLGLYYFSDEYIMSADYANQNLIKKMFVLGIWARLHLYKYITCWLLTEGVCITFGLSYNGVDENGKSKWDGCANVDLLTFENATRFNHYIQAFNINSNKWFAEYIYKRLKFLGSRVASQAFTLLFVAVWHGFHSGYYLTFFNEFIIMYFEKDIGPTLEKNDKLQSAINSPIGKPLTWLLLKIYTLVFMGHAFLPFPLLAYDRYMPVYAATKWCGFVIFCSYPILAPYIKRAIRGTRARPHVE